ncbi:MAG: hypothetical protein MJ107_09340 [Lachnospiraceae bacterium]|nr:hypothetical protein [Lachnospiraceae bacterium]
MTNYSIMNTVHNFYMTSYAPKSNSPFDTHKKSELRSVYNSIVKLNKEAPLYIVDQSAATQEFAVGMKENARSLKNTIASLGGMEEEDLLNKKTAFSSDEDIATASFVGELDEGDEAPTVELAVDALAKPQVNMGRFLPDNEPVGLFPNTYSFDININDLNYEFQFKIREGDTNRDVQDRLARLINNSNIGLEASVNSSETDSGSSYLRIASEATGLKDGSPIQFTLSEDHSSKAAGAIGYLGIDYMTQGAANSQFSVNGEAYSTASNNFTIGKMYEVNLQGVGAEGSTTKIGLKTDIESLQENLTTLVRGYNDFLRVASEFTAEHPGSNRLVGEMSRLTRYYAEGLTGAGVNLNLDGSLEIDAKAFRDSVTGSEAADNLSAVKDFTQSLLRKTNEVSLNPMEYANKTIVAYKNPGKNFASPYITSAYSGMLFNSYC